MEQLELSDIQGLIVRGYSNMSAACFVLLAVPDAGAGAAKRWLSSIAGEVTEGANRTYEHCVNLAFTYEGLRRLGLAHEALEMLPLELQENMWSRHRQRVLGDKGTSAPEFWQWGGPANDPIHVLLMLYADGAEALDALYGTHAARWSQAGLALVKRLDSAELPMRKEHFGFHDGIAQPVIAGLTRTGPPGNVVPAGEFVLGYRNAYDRYPDSPTVPAAAKGPLPAIGDGTGRGDFGRNGSYLVFRQLEQNVSGFWSFMDCATKAPDGTSDPDAMIRLAAKIVGRWPNGEPLVTSPEKEFTEPSTRDDFLYEPTDPHGDRCPIGSHIRRANPRDSMAPGPEQSLVVVNRHRIVRRGRSYGTPASPALDPRQIAAGAGADAAPSGSERGLHFLCFNANIGRQFEFITQTWINNPKFDGLYNDADPALGDPDNTAAKGTFTIQNTPVRTRITNLPRFITTRGGSYFFMPSIRALQYLASA